MTRLCVPLFVNEPDAAWDLASQAKDAGADLIEWRVDTLVRDATNDDDLVQAITQRVTQSPLPCILTCRGTDEGGHFDGDEATLITALLAAIDAGVAFLDVELARWKKSPALRAALTPRVTQDAPGTGLILSTHDFDRRPADLTRRLAAMLDEPACRIIKAAWTARSLRDNLEAFDLLTESAKPAILLGMGEHGLASRVLAKKFGAFLTFASLNDTQGTAPGQPTLADMKTLYRWDAITPSTRVYGVVGHPVSHSKSPHLHNAGFTQCGIDAVYLPMPIAPAYEAFKATIGSWLDHKTLHFTGCSVTIPHKSNLLRFVDEEGGDIEPLTREIAAANTLTRRDDGTLHARNTDYPGALDAVCDGLAITREQLSGKRVAVLGAGGAARAVVAGFKAYGADITIYNRTFDKAEALAQTTGTHALPWEQRTQLDATVLINCTSIGMHPNTDDSPLPDAENFQGFAPGVVVFDTIYNPIETQLLRDAKRAGCHTITGLEMFMRQGALQFKAWTNQTMPRIDVSV